ncbi:sodium-dependent bicarbonate transport family permease [Chitinimonas viridis]|uniref:Sodium-dependent bicarbonate transport family permease n=1 Tax=Chitinimonas viridis TaxID=664880 RepID=A0ABT8BC56_9NEIS|nr:sodium-dependent bicarbonate transport family permease [Chitinimonas viridis]MDN3579029.1 sodium-dependent bicarbonate transport family permease [Chitinimonas viridis]
MQSLLDPAILFFVFGVAAGLLKSNLEIPPAISRFLSLYLLMALGLKGGFALAHSGLTGEVATTLAIAVSLAILVPLLGYVLLRRAVGSFDAAALAATYGSVSAVTFITATQYLEIRGYGFGGHMAAAMALMEAPAIVLAVLIANQLRQKAGVVVVENSVGVFSSAPSGGMSIGKVVHESLTDGAQLLLLGAMLIGLLTGEAGKAAMQPFSGDLFKGMLAFFLLDMGLNAARQLPQLRGSSPWLLAYAVLAPIAHAGFTLLVCLLMGVQAGNATLLMVLAASASYIAVPAALRLAIPEARPALYFGMSLGITFPFNILLGIPLYTGIAHSVLSYGNLQ